MKVITLSTAAAGCLALCCFMGCENVENIELSHLGTSDSDSLDAYDGEDAVAGRALAGNGLTGKYFNNADFTSKVLTRVDSVVNFNWKLLAPPSLDSDEFSVRWTGFVKPKYSQTYTFYVSSDEGARLWVNGQKLIDHWTSHTFEEKSGTIALQAGKSYPISLDYYENTGNARVELRWSSASQVKQLIPKEQLFVSNPEGCATRCSGTTPICGKDLKCTSTRWVEPIETLPDRWKTKTDTKVWTKWVRSIVPVLGQAKTQDAALLEVAYFAEKIVYMPQKKILATDLFNSMLDAYPTRFFVYPACPNAFMHPSVQPTMSSGGAGPTSTTVSEDWILRYPKCTGANAVACDQIPEGTLCNNCQWQNASEPESCRDTLAHEHGHTIDVHRASFIDSSIHDIDKELFPYNPSEGPAWSASKYFMNPSLASRTGRDNGQIIMPQREKDYWSITHGFTMSEYPAETGYILKTTRCPEKGLTEACDDTLTRTYAVPLDSER